MNPMPNSSCKPFVPTEGDPVRVEWHDAYAYVGWDDSVGEVEPMVSYGFFVREDNTHIVIALNRGKDLYSNITLIPKGALIRCNEIRSVQT